MAELVKPIRCTVYDKDDNYLGYVDSGVAKNYINPDLVRTEIDNLNSTIEEGLSTISKAITDEALPEAENSLVVRDTNTTEIFDEVETILTDGSIMSGISESTEQIYTESVSAHNQIQENANEDARATAKGIDGYSRMVETNREA